ncbi:hypothetical protein [Actinomyces ruminis]|uniref:hypothetical protein n=1 Tax=Actinomyces ruminis TaxID=1937003 RepID=UPI000A380B1C
MSERNDFTNDRGYGDRGNRRDRYDRGDRRDRGDYRGSGGYDRGYRSNYRGDGDRGYGRDRGYGDRREDRGYSRDRGYDRGGRGYGQDRGYRNNRQDRDYRDNRGYGDRRGRDYQHDDRGGRGYDRGGRGYDRSGRDRDYRRENRRHDKGPRTGTLSDLVDYLHVLDGRSYAAYRDTIGHYRAPEAGSCTSTTSSLIPTPRPRASAFRFLPTCRP